MRNVQKAAAKKKELPKKKPEERVTEPPVIRLFSADFNFSSDKFPYCCAAEIVYDLDYTEQGVYINGEYFTEEEAFLQKKGATKKLWNARTFTTSKQELTRLKKRLFKSDMTFIITAHYQVEWEAVLPLLGFQAVHKYKRRAHGNTLTVWMTKPKK